MGDLLLDPPRLLLELVLGGGWLESFDSATEFERASVWVELVKVMNDSPTPSSLLALGAVGHLPVPTCLLASLRGMEVVLVVG